MDSDRFNCVTVKERARRNIGIALFGKDFEGTADAWDDKFIGFRFRHQAGIRRINDYRIQFPIEKHALIPLGYESFITVYFKKEDVDVFLRTFNRLKNECLESNKILTEKLTVMEQVLGCKILPNKKGKNSCRKRKIIEQYTKRL